MQIQISGHHVELTDGLRDYVTEKLGRVKKRFNNITSVSVILSLPKKYEQKAEATIHLSKGEINAQATADDMYAAIDALIDKLERQVTKHKEKMEGHSNNGTAHHNHSEDMEVDE